MTKRKTLTYVGSGYMDRLAGLSENGTSSFDIEVSLTQDLGALFRAVCLRADYDVAELSLSNYLSMRGNGDTRYIAIPVFPSRSFRHAQIYVSAASGITTPEQLRGCRAAISEYHMTAGVWMRAFLEHDFGVSPSEIEWHTPDHSVAYIDEVGFPVPDDVSLVAAAGPLEELLDSGEVDALFAVKAPSSYERGSPNVKRLFPDYRAVEAHYFQRTGLFPIMHTVVINSETYANDRSVAMELLQAFDAAKQAGIRRLTDLNATAIVHPWIGAVLADVVELFDGDPFVYGIPPNRRTLQALLDYHFEQGLTRERLTTTSVFAPETLEWIPPVDSLRNHRW
jgi:4,5-dihydroxyphthalate decarboxylase